MKLLTVFVLLFTLCATAQKNEYMSWEDLSINQKIPLTISKKDFDKKYSGNYEVTDPLPGESCSTGNTVTVADYKGARYEIVNDTLQFRSIDFSRRRNMYIQFKNDWFDHSTTFKYFKKAYPIAAGMAEEYIDENGETGQIITFFPEDENALYEWRLYFKDGKLETFECFLYCF